MKAPDTLLASVLLMVGVGLVAAAGGGVGPWWLGLLGGVSLFFVPAAIVDALEQRHRSRR